MHISNKDLYMDKNTELLLKTSFDALEEKKAEDIVILDIKELSPIADYFIIANGTNKNQLLALTDNVDEKMHKAGFSLHAIEGANTDWVLMDYGDLIIHIFSRDDRAFYDLERIWSDGKAVTL